MAEPLAAARPPAAGAPVRWLVLAAFAAVYVIWGSTYLAIRIAIETLPPFLMAGVRFLVAGALLYAWARLTGAPRPTRVHWRATAVIGAFLLFGGTGGVAWAEQTVPSGITALLIAAVPLWMVLLDWLRPGGSRPGGAVLLGLGVGFAGVIVLVGPGEIAGSGGVDPVGAAVIMVACLSWAVGSLYSRGAPLPDSPLLSTAMEMLAGGAILTAAGLVTGEASRVEPAAVSAASLAALGYLVVFGSIIAFNAYVWLLRNAATHRVATYAYVNPVVAVVLGWAVAGEEIGPRTLLAAAIIVGAVALITTARSAGGKTPTAEAAAAETAGAGEGRALFSRLRRRRRRCTSPG